MFEWQILKKKNVPDVLVDLEEAFFNDLIRTYITETSKVTPDYHLTLCKNRGNLGLK